MPQDVIQTQNRPVFCNQCMLDWHKIQTNGVFWVWMIFYGIEKWPVNSTYMRLRDSANSMMCSAKVKMTGNFRVRSSGRGLEIRIGQGLSLSPIISPRSSAISKLEFAQNLKNGMIFYFKKIHNRGQLTNLSGKTDLYTG